MAQGQIVKLNTGEIGSILECDKDNDEYKIRVVTPLFDDYEFITSSSTDFKVILQIDRKSEIHNYGLSTLINLNRFGVIFSEPILIPFAPRINNDNNNDEMVTSKILKWWNHIKQSSNINKMNVFMSLSYHDKGPIVDNIDEFMKKNKLLLIDKYNKYNKYNKLELNELRKGLLIDGANTFDQGCYELICRINHCCDPNCFVTTNGEVKSLRYINKYQELTWNFLNDKYLYLSTNIRMKRLYEIWGFRCNCFRCNAHFDDARIFKCIKCSKPSIYISYIYDNKQEQKEQEGKKEEYELLTKFHDCFECNYKLKKHEIEYYLSMENEIDKLIESMSINGNEMEFQHKLDHLKHYLSVEHFKWFHLWYSMIFQFDDNKDRIFGKTLKYSLIKCYEAMNKIYNNCMNSCKWMIQWKLLNCIVHEKSIKKSEKKLIIKLYHSINETKHIFMDINIKWNKITDIINHEFHSC